GIKFHRAAFDFAWVPFGDLGNTFRYSLTIRFAGATGTQAAAPAPTPAPAQAEATPGK
ncbi:MAG: hypothetical protein HY925_13950, partial [Elusimicrobia bacterium]|nr:hypothetical protein [Elusimicrobiota bacterium]MBI5202690.1 hypothetical protein [Elusimicrobiota bacterium]